MVMRLPGCTAPLYVRVFRQKVTLQDAIGSHACSLEARMRVPNAIPLGCLLLLPAVTVNCVQTLKAGERAHTRSGTAAELMSLLDALAAVVLDHRTVFSFGERGCVRITI
jgi:hypothetical protein